MDNGKVREAIDATKVALEKNVRSVIICSAMNGMQQLFSEMIFGKNALGLFERQDELPSTGSAAWLWHVRDLIILDLP